MLTASQLLAVTPRTVRSRSKSPKIKIIKDSKSGFRKREFRAVYTKTSLYNTDSTGSSYTLIIRNYGTERNPLDWRFKPSSKLWVHCSCPYFTYYLEVALTLKQSSSVYDSNGDMPNIRNPKKIPYLCKHLYATLGVLLEKEKATRK